MTTVPVRLARGLMWLVLTVLVLAAVAISGLRFYLPQLNEYREPIRQWASEQIDMDLDLELVEGHWRNFGPSLVLQGVKVNLPGAPESLVKVGDVSMQLDMMGTVLSLSPVFQDIRIDELSLDLTRLSGTESSNTASSERSQMATIERLEELLFVQLGQFSVRNSDITLMSPAEEKLTVDIKELKWDTHNRQRRAEGVVSIADTHFSQMQVIANLSDNRSWAKMSGDIYLQARNLSVTPWLNKQHLTDANITGSNLNAEVWLTLSGGALQQSLVKLDDSFLRWQLGEEKHQFRVRQGLVQLEPQQNENGESGWRIDSDQMVLETDDTPWPAFDIAASWLPGDWKLAATNLSLENLQPFVTFLPDDSELVDVLSTLQPSGQISDIRVAASKDSAPQFSFHVSQLGLKQWELLPGIHKLDAVVAGNTQGGRAMLNLKEDELPYGDVFQAPLNIDAADVTAYWQVGEDGWRLWSDKIDVATPHLKVDGQFRLDFPADAPSWLSFYGEASLNNAGETWRYLPTLALGRSLTDYLSAAIRGGQAESAQLLWYGELADFPYGNHDGVFQAYVPLRQGKFSFDTAWPELTDLKLDLLFENDFMYLDATHAKTMGATASKVTGDAELSSDGHLKLTVDVAAEGDQVRDYMLATPLVDSVGAALTTVQVSGPVTSQFKLDIPFDGEDVRAWGRAELTGNQVQLDAPPLTLEGAIGTIEFDDDKVSAEKITANLLAQPVNVSFSGNSVAEGYRVDVALDGDWQVETLQQQVQDPLLAKVTGRSRWQGTVGVDLNDTGFEYQVGIQAALKDAVSTLPYPLALAAGSPDTFKLDVTGNGQSLVGKATLPGVAYQAKIDLSGEKLNIDASQMAIGKTALHRLKAGEHGLDIVADKVDGDSWVDLISAVHDKVEADAASNSASVKPDIPVPTRIEANVRQIKLASLDWNRVVLSASQRADTWQFRLDSREAKGQARWPKGQPLDLAIDTFHLNLPQVDVEKPKEKYKPQRDIPAATDFDRSMMANLPEMDLMLKDAWLQGYRLGEVSGKLRREGNMLELVNFTVDSGATSLNLDGHWSLDGDRSETQIAFDIEGKNSSDLMGRFGITGGIQGAKFSTYASIQWQGAPWSMHRETLTGELKSETGQGVISDIGGAGRLLGLFSIDSLIRRMQLDFSGIFDEGLAFNYIRGSGRIENGRFETDNIKMQALAGDMFIRGSANLVNETVDARVRFIPDFTSGIPVLTAFAVAPQTAIYVFAISTALSPVLDVFTQVNYVVKGPIDSPVVTEQSRFTGEYNVSEMLKGKDKEAK
ncbi:TIGR02099 family protein [Photobacterium rosenbergii]|uniref:TIGR02099 family protein n=1 Tax=Photobacterium rosenbergii TaxID=294936 RepID=A0A2T3N8L8_9GAMM|nr:YhdP family protein [Photobacterium rosenbergii]PSW09613.1 TIGR02099 family protein [Photobacterium rosenbergii]